MVVGGSCETKHSSEKTIVPGCVVIVYKNNFHLLLSDENVKLFLSV